MYCKANGVSYWLVYVVCKCESRGKNEMTYIKKKLYKILFSGLELIYSVQVCEETDYLSL